MKKFQNIGSLGDIFVIFDHKRKKKKKKKYIGPLDENMILRGLWVESELKMEVFWALYSVPSNVGVPPPNSSL